MSICLILSGCSEEVVLWPTRGELVNIVQAAAQAPDPTLRAEIVRISARSGAPELEAIVEEAAQDDSPLVIAAALESALQKGDSARIGTLFDRLSNGSESARSAGLDLYLSYAPADDRARELDRALRQPNAAVRRFAVRRILSARDSETAVDEAVVNQLLDLGDATIASEVADLLTIQNDPNRLSNAYTRLLSEDANERLSALRVFAVAPSFNIWPYLRWYRQHGDTGEQSLALLGLARLGDGTVSNELRELLLVGEPELMPLAIRALAGLSDPSDLRQLASYRGDTRPEIRGAVARTLIAMNAQPEELLEFIEDSEPDISNYVTQYLLEADANSLGERICSQIRLSRDPLPLLRFIWLMWTESHSDILTRACRPQIESLLDSEVDSVRYLAARLFFSMVAPDPTGLDADVFADYQFLYAYLEASLDWDPDSYRHVYLELLDHELVIVRAIASVGLLKTTLQ